MSLEYETLEQLFDRWNAILGEQPDEREIEQLKAITLFTFADKEYRKRREEQAYFQEWLDLLPGYFRRKADVMLAILNRLKFRNPRTLVVSEIRNNIPQLSHVLFARYLAKFVLKDPLELERIEPSEYKPEWLNPLSEKGVTFDEMRALAQIVSDKVLDGILAITDGYGWYGDLPRNAPHPVPVEATYDTCLLPRYLDGMHDYAWDITLFDSDEA